MKYNPSKIERKWQRWWETNKLYEAPDFSGGNLPAGRQGKNFMLLVEFPYPSGDLHTGHWYAFAVPDIYGRYLRMNGYNVSYPIGFDAFGLPAENAAIQRNIHPRDWTKKNIKNMTKQLKSMGAMFDWSRQVSTIEPEYYKWTQWIFLQLYKAGLAYRPKTAANWCPNDKTVLANEQVVDGKCDRCGTQVIQKEIEQWMFKITSFADRLIDDMKELDWPESTKKAQENWIGRSEGAKIKFPIISSHLPINDQLPKLETGNWKLENNIEVFTTRPDTIYGATFLVVAPESEAIKNLKFKIKNWPEVQAYIEQANKKTELQRQEGREKTGVELKGLNAINPMTDEPIPVWVADYVLGHYGTGQIMAVPAHDERDREFAEKYNLPIKEMVPEDMKKIMEALKEKGVGESKKNYRLHDWLLSRQRYWGAPIPMIHCAECGYVPVPEDKLPVKLPALDNFLPADDGRSPLAKAEKWLKVKCPECGKPAERETDTMDTFVDSSWYYLRYADPKNKDEFASKPKVANWLPIPLYFGGADHNTMHLLYSRFTPKALRILNLVVFSEPFLSRRNHGIIMGPDGQKMSKSKGNVVDPDEQVAKYGADTVRMYFAFMGPYDQNYAWNFDGVLGVRRFLDRVWNFVQRFEDKKSSEVNSSEINLVIHRAIKEVGEQIKHHKFNTGVSALMKLLNELERLASSNYKLSPISYQLFLKLLAPYAPHMAEELWASVLINEGSIHNQGWPEVDESLLDAQEIKIIVQVNGKVRATVMAKPGISESEVRYLAMADSAIQKYLAGAEPKKVIYVKDKLINLVV